MGFICTSGFELQEPDTTAPANPADAIGQSFPDGCRLDVGTGTGCWSVETSIVRSGGASRGFPDGYVTFCEWRAQTGDAVLGTGFYASAWFYPTSSFTNVRDIIGLTRRLDLVPSIKAQWDGSTQKVGLFYGGSYGTGTQVGSYSAALTLNAWHLIELYGKVSAGANDECQLRVRGDVVATGSGLSINDNPIDSLWLGVIGVTGTAGSPVCYFDDVICSTSGFLYGQTRVAFLPPASDVQVGKWLRGAGGATNLRLAVNNIPPAGLNSASKTNASQIKSDALDSNADGPTETYQARMRTYRTAGIPGGHQPLGIQVAVCHGEDAAAGTKTLTAQIIANPAEPSALACTAGFDAGACGTYPTNWGWNRSDGVGGVIVDADTGPLVEIASTTASNALVDVCAIAVVVVYDSNETQYQHARTTRTTHRSPRLRR